MNLENDRPQNRKSADVAFYAIGAGLMLVISIPLTLALLFAEKPRDWSAADSGFAALLLCVGWSLTASLLASCFRHPRMQKIGRTSAMVGGLVFVAFLIAVFLRAFVDSRESPPAGTATFGSVLLVNSAVGLLLFLSGRRRWKISGKKSDETTASPLMIIIWPFLLFGVSPVGGLLYLASIAGVAFLGEWIGGKFFHPLLGSLASTSSLLFLLLILMRLAPGKKKPAENNPPTPP